MATTTTPHCPARGSTSSSRSTGPDWRRAAGDYADGLPTPTRGQRLLGHRDPAQDAGPTRGVRGNSAGDLSYLTDQRIRQVNPAHEWMKQNAALYGWFHPSWAEPDGSLPESWHWEHSG